MSMAFLSQGKSNKHISLDQQRAVVFAKEWDIGMQKGFISFRIQTNHSKDIIEDPIQDEDAKVISYTKMLRTYSSNTNR